MSPQEALRAAFTDWIASLPPGLHPGVQRTPERVVAALDEMTSGYAVNIEELVTTFDADGYDQMIAVGGIPFQSLCEHHVMTFTGFAHVAYLPDRSVIGLSKIPRLVEAFSRRLQIQERLTQQIANALDVYLEPRGVMSVVEATHSCMCHRGVRSSGVMRTSAVLGVIREDAAARSEAEWLLKL